MKFSLIGKATVIAATLSLAASCGKEEEKKVVVKDLGAELAEGVTEDQVTEGMMPDAAIVKFVFDPTTGKVTKVERAVSVAASSSLSDANIDQIYNSLSAENSLEDFSSADSFPSANYCHPQSGSVTSVSYFQNCGGIGQLSTLPSVDLTNVTNQVINNNNVTNTHVFNNDIQNTIIHNRRYNNVTVIDEPTINTFNYVNRNFDATPYYNNYNMWQAPQGGFHGCSTTVVSYSSWCGNNGGLTPWTGYVTNFVRPVMYYQPQGFRTPIRSMIRNFRVNRAERVLYRAGMRGSRMFMPAGANYGYVSYCRTTTCGFLN